MESVSIAPLINEILAGTSRAVVALLILVIVIMANEIRTARKDYREAITRIENQRTDFLKLIDDIQGKFLQKSEEMIEKYHSVMAAQQESMNKLRETLHTVSQSLPQHNHHLNNQNKRENNNDHDT